MDYDKYEPKTMVEITIDHYKEHKFAYGIIVGLFLYQPLFYFLFGLKMLIWEMGVK